MKSNRKRYTKILVRLPRERKRYGTEFNVERRRRRRKGSQKNKNKISSDYLHYDFRWWPSPSCISSCRATSRNFVELFRMFDDRKVVVRVNKRTKREEFAQGNVSRFWANLKSFEWFMKRTRRSRGRTWVGRSQLSLCLLNYRKVNKIMIRRPSINQ